MHFAAFPAASCSAWTREPAAKDQSESSRLRWRRLTVMSSANGKIQRRRATCPKDLTNRYSGEFSATVQRQLCVQHHCNPLLMTHCKMCHITFWNSSLWCQSDVWATKISLLMQCESELQNKPSVSTELNCFVPYEVYRHQASQRTDWEWLEGSLALWNMSGSDPTKTNIPFKPRIGWTSLIEVHQDHSINIFFRSGVRQFFFCFSLMLLSKCWLQWLWNNDTISAFSCVYRWAENLSGK